MKNLFLVAIITMFSSTVNAQEFKFAIKSGLNLAKIDYDGDALDDRASFHAGGVVELVFSEKISLQTEVVFSDQGAKGKLVSFEEIDSRIEEEFTLKLSYINVPVLAKYYIIKGLSIEAGPQLGVLIKAEADYKMQITSESGEVIETSSGTNDIKDFYKNIDFGLGFGAAYKLDLGLSFGVRYNLGLTNINENENFERKNKVLQFSLGYFF